MNDFLDIVRADGIGGVTIDLDHPQGTLSWRLPGERADELVQAIRSRQGYPDRPPQEDYARVSIVRGPFNFEPGVEHRSGDNFVELCELMEAVALDVATSTHATAMDAAKEFGRRVTMLWPDRGWFVECWSEGERWFAQSYQPFGKPRFR